MAHGIVIESSERGHGLKAIWLMSSMQLLATIVTLMLAGCGAEASPQDDARKVASNIRAAAGGDATCPLDASEVSKLMGKKVVDGVSIMGCAYDYASTGKSAAALLTAEARYYSDGGSRSKELPGIGEAAHIERDQQDWRAAARRGDKFVHVYISGEAATRDVAIAVLKAALSKI